MTDGACGPCWSWCLSWCFSILSVIMHSMTQFLHVYSRKCIYSKISYRQMQFLTTKQYILPKNDSVLSDIKNRHMFVQNTQNDIVDHRKLPKRLYPPQKRKKSMLIFLRMPRWSHCPMSFVFSLCVQRQHCF